MTNAILMTMVKEAELRARTEGADPVRALGGIARLLAAVNLVLEGRLEALEDVAQATVAADRGYALSDRLELLSAAAGKAIRALGRAGVGIDPKCSSRR